MKTPKSVRIIFIVGITTAVTLFAITNLIGAEDPNYNTMILIGAEDPNNDTKDLIDAENHNDNEEKPSEVAGPGDEVSKPADPLKNALNPKSPAYDPSLLYGAPGTRFGPHVDLETEEDESPTP